MAFVTVAKTEDVPVGEVRVFNVDSRSIALAHVEDGFYAIDNVCTHDGGPLGEGILWDAQVECPRHGARFDVKTGRVTALPAAVPVKTYPVQVQGDEVKVDAG